MNGPTFDETSEPMTRPAFCLVPWLCFLGANEESVEPSVDPMCVLLDELGSGGGLVDRGPKQTGRLLGMEDYFACLIIS